MERRQLYHSTQRFTNPGKVSAMYRYHHIASVLRFILESNNRTYFKLLPAQIQSVLGDGDGVRSTEHRLAIAAKTVAVAEGRTLDDGTATVCEDCRAGVVRDLGCGGRVYGHVKNSNGDGGWTIGEMRGCEDRTSE